MWLIGYYLDRGILPEHIFQLDEGERLLYEIMAELNHQQRREELRDDIMTAFLSAHNGGD